MSDTDDLALTISRALDKLRAGMQEPVWTPLEALLPMEWCSGFMFTMAHEAEIMPNGLALLRKDMCVPGATRLDAWGKPWERRWVFNYKHGITRRYLFIGDDLRCYAYRSECPLGEPIYMPIPPNWAIECAFDGLEELGATRTTAYNAEFIAARNARLVAAGFRVVS